MSYFKSLFTRPEKTSQRPIAAQYGDQDGTSKSWGSGKPQARDIATTDADSDQRSRTSRSSTPDSTLEFKKISDPEKEGSIGLGISESVLEQAIDKDDVYPEGGARAWSVVFGSFCAMTVTFGMITNTAGSIQAYISTHQLSHMNDSAIGWIFSINIFVAFFAALQVGVILDRSGPRLLLLCGSVLITASLILVSFSTAYYHFLLSWGVVGGLGIALTFTPAICCIGHWFKEYRATATCIATTGGSVGGVVFPLLLRAMFQVESLGFAWGMRLLALICVVLSVISNWLIRSRLPPAKSASAWPDLTILKDPCFALTTIATMLIECGLFVPLAFIAQYALAHGFSISYSYSIIAIINGVSGIGRILPGYVADRIGRYNTMIVALALCTLSIFGLWLPAGDSPVLLVLFAVFFGFSSGSNISLTPSCIGQLCDTESYGRYYASAYTWVSFGCLAGIPTAGALVTQQEGDYSVLIVFVGLCYGVGLACFVAARIIKVGTKLTAWF